MQVAGHAKEAGAQKELTVRGAWVNQRLRRLCWKFPVYGVWSPRKGKQCFSEQRTAGAGGREQAACWGGAPEAIVTQWG